MNLNIILLENKKKHNHLMYLIDDYFLIDPTYKGLQFYTCNFKTLYKLKSVLQDYKIIDNVIIEVEEDKRKVFLKPFIFNCISFGKLTTGINGVFLTCKSFIKKIKKVKNEKNKI